MMDAKDQAEQVVEEWWAAHYEGEPTVPHDDLITRLEAVILSLRDRAECAEAALSRLLP